MVEIVRIYIVVSADLMLVCDSLDDGNTDTVKVNGVIVKEEPLTYRQALEVLQTNPTEIFTFHEDEIEWSILTKND